MWRSAGASVLRPHLNVSPLKCLSLFIAYVFTEDLELNDSSCHIVSHLFIRKNMNASAISRVWYVVFDGVFDCSYRLLSCKVSHYVVIFFFFECILWLFSSSRYNQVEKNQSNHPPDPFPLCIISHKHVGWFPSFFYFLSFVYPHWSSSLSYK